MLRFTSVFVTLLVLSSAAYAGERVIDFSKAPLGQTPSGFRSILVGRGKPADWRVIVEPSTTNTAASTGAATAPKQVLAQLSEDGTDEHFPLLVLDDAPYSDFKVTLRFKIVSGLFEQMAGLAFRIQDTNNYYYVRASALGNNFRFIKVVNGQRLTTVGPDMEITRGVWHELSVECQGNQFAFQLDGKAAIPPLNDSTFESGKIAFLTKSDSVAYFGDTRIVYTPHESLARIIVREAMQHYPNLVGLKVYSTDNSQGVPTIIASTYDDEIGRTGGQVEKDVITRDVSYWGKEEHVALVTLPLHDRNGDVAAAVRVVLKSFPGQTEQNAVARAQPVVRDMEKRIRTAKDLMQ